MQLVAAPCAHGRDLILLNIGSAICRNGSSCAIFSPFALATPRAILGELASQIAKLLADPAMRDKLTAMALEPLTGSTPDGFAAYIRTEVDRWAAIVENSGAELE